MRKNDREWLKGCAEELMEPTSHSGMNKLGRMIMELLDYVEALQAQVKRMNAQMAMTDNLIFKAIKKEVQNDG